MEALIARGRAPLLDNTATTVRPQKRRWPKDENSRRRFGAVTVDSFNASQVLVSAPEAERMIEHLQPYGVAEVGSVKWLEQHDWIQKLNIQAHHNTQRHAEEFVAELLVSCDKMNVLVHQLLAAEVWKEKLLPLLKKHLARKVDSVTSFQLQYHEVALANLLELALYDRHVCEALDEEHLMELTDWCYRKLRYLNTQAHEDAVPSAGGAKCAETDAKALLDMSALQQLEQKEGELRFGCAMCSLSILRYLTDHVHSLPMGVLSRLLSSNDTIMALLPLIENPPWLRRRGGQQELWEDNAWTTVAGADRLRVGKHGAQVWLAMNNLLVEPKCRAKYELDGFRKEALMRLRRFLNELMFDQLPVLKDLQRILDELALNHNSVPADMTQSAPLILEQVCTIRESMLAVDSWKELADKAKKSFFGEESAERARQRAVELAKTFEFLADLSPEVPSPAPDQAQGGDSCAKTAAAQTDAMDSPVKLSCWLKDKQQGLMTPWCDYQLAINPCKPPEPVELDPGSDPASGGCHAAAVVNGMRYRLCAVDADSTRPLPTLGKIAVVHGNRSAEALLELPAPATRDATDVPPAVWLTIGLLASDGFALQLKLKRSSRPKERDRSRGGWHAYHPVGGAITLLRDNS